MLNVLEISDLYKFEESLPESKEKDLLCKLLFEYVQYSECGTVEDCMARKEWMSYSIDDIRKNFTSIVKGLREEVAYIREDAELSHKRKRGRPKRRKGIDYEMQI